MQREQVLELMKQISKRQGHNPVFIENASLRDIGFRSLDFSELALRVEQSIGQELNFDAGRLRGIQTVADVLDFFRDVTSDA